MSPRPEEEPSGIAPATSGTDGENARFYTIGELASEFGITTRAIRFYEARGLIAPRRVGTSRSYSHRDRVRLMLILRAKNLGFTLEDVAEYLALYDADPQQQAQTQLLLAKVETAIKDLMTKRADLDRTLRELKDIRGKCVEHLRKSGAG
jgi:DNA-binding transcriptional MerR regulator